MSVESVARALNLPDIGGTEKLILIGIANHDGDGGAWPSIATLARYAWCTERHVQQLIARLITRGLLTVEHNAGGNDGTRSDRRPNRYRLHFPPGDNSPHGVNPSSPRGGHGVKFSPSRGELQRANGVNPTSPEPSFNRPIERAPESAMAVDNSPRFCIACDGPIEADRVLKTRCASCQSTIDAQRQTRLALEGDPA